MTRTWKNQKYNMIRKLDIEKRLLQVDGTDYGKKWKLILHYKKIAKQNYGMIGTLKKGWTKNGKKWQKMEKVLHVKNVTKERNWQDTKKEHRKKGNGSKMAKIRH